MRFAIAVCIFLSAYFSAAETAFNSVNLLHLKSLKDQGDNRATLVLLLLDSYEKLLASILIGNNLVNIAASSMATTLFVQKFGSGLGLGISTFSITMLLLIFGEISPKSIAKASADKFAMFIAPSIQLIMIVFTPLTFLFDLWQRLLLKIFHVEAASVTDQEILTIVKEAEEEGGIDKVESMLISKSVIFQDKDAEDILTPRVDIQGIRSDALPEDVLKRFMESGFSRLPVYKDNIDNILGILYQKDFYYAYEDAFRNNPVFHFNKEGKAEANTNTDTDTDIDAGSSINKLLRPVVFTTAHKPIGDLLRELQNKKCHVAIVVDEYGGTLGMVTIEDIVEELVGEIWDEHEEAVQDIRKISPHKYVVSGSAALDDFFNVVNYKDNEKFEATTVSGWVTELCGRLPNEGERIRFENMKIYVKAMGERRVKTIEVLLDPVPEP